jgi:hypothetical protein
MYEITKYIIKYSITHVNANKYMCTYIYICIYLLELKCIIRRFINYIVKPSTRAL